MIVVRNVFRLKYGQARAALALWKEGRPIMMRAIQGPAPRLLTDVVGPSYTLVMETTHASMAEFEQAGHSVMSSDEWRAWYQRFVPLVESGYREIFTLVE